MILSERRGSWSQTIRINTYSENEIEISRYNKLLYKGIARHIIDTGNEISFKDGNNKQHQYIKHNYYTVS